MESLQKNPKNAKEPDVKTSRHASRFFVIGVILAIFNYGLYALIANMIINNNDFLWLSSFIASAFTTILAYILHSKITWKERSPGKTGIYKFLIWNILLTIAINPILTQLFGLITPIHDITYSITSSLNFPFTYEFVQSTGAFILTAIITMILNFLFYDRFVFGKSKNMIE
ncbi:GtrA family protein [Candidatus Saccharibacteria bacterium]|nr:GtrA family protein [Candidatus Saccharibacteria bacterium]